MSLSLWVDQRCFPVGSREVLTAFFSTILVRVESGCWGSQYPLIMRDLYAGRVLSSLAGAALDEVDGLRLRLAEHPPDEVVWDFEHQESRPPWGKRLSPHISSLANYFVTSDGKDFLDVLSNALAEAGKTGQDLTIG